MFLLIERSEGRLGNLGAGVLDRTLHLDDGQKDWMGPEGPEEAQDLA